MNDETNCSIDHGAIENGREFFRRLTDHYQFKDEQDHALINCYEFEQLKLCFETIVEALQPHPPQPDTFIVNDNGDYEWVARKETPDIDVSPQEICKLLNASVMQPDTVTISRDSFKKVKRALEQYAIRHDGINNKAWDALSLLNAEGKV